MSMVDELQKLHQLHQTGALNDEEYARAKAKLLNESPSGSYSGIFSSPASLKESTRQWAMLLHISQLLSSVAPIAGQVVPIAIWQLKKSSLPGIDDHGKVVTNWIISQIIYYLVCVPLVFVFIGFGMAAIVYILGIIFPIIGAIKANNGELWPYPLSIRFFR